MVNAYFFHTYFWKKIDLGGYAAFYFGGFSSFIIDLWLCLLLAQCF